MPNPNAPEADTATITIVVTPTECGTFKNPAIIPFVPLAAVEQLSAEQQQPVGAAPITQDTEQESESGEIDQSFEVT